MICKSGFHVIWGSGRVGLMHDNPIFGAGRGGSGAGLDNLPRPPGRGGVEYW